MSKWALICVLGFYPFRVLANDVMPATTDNLQTRASFGLRVDCMNSFNRDKGSNQDCMNLTGLRVALSEQLTASTKGQVVFDPFGTPLSHLSRTPFRQDIPLNRDNAYGLIDHYEIAWEPRPNLTIKLSEFSGTTAIPSLSGLALASVFSTQGWDQTALEVAYDLQALAGMRVRLVTGNGEGERFSNQDPQQFFAFGITSDVMTGLGFQVGVSYDGNSAGSDEYTWLNDRFVSQCGGDVPIAAKQGYAMQRLGASVFMDGNLAAARGLKVALGWQQSVASDLDKNQQAYPSLAELDNCPSLDPDLFFVEDDDQDSVNSVQRVVLGASASYRILDTYFVGFDFESRRIESGNVKIFQVCEGYDGIDCPASLRGTRSSSLDQSAYTTGAGMDLDDGLTVSLEYHRRSFEKNFTKFYYVGRNDKPTDTLELFNARIAYNWP